MPSNSQMTTSGMGQQVEGPVRGERVDEFAGERLDARTQPLHLARDEGARQQ
jgi:hypothetical protein